MYGFEQCCDAYQYTDLGRACFADISKCWDPLRPIGAITLNAIAGPKGVVLINHLLLLVVAFIMIRIERRDSGVHIEGSVPRKFLMQFAKVAGLFFVLELLFFGLASVTLSDVPAGVFATLAIIGFTRKEFALFAIAAGICVLVRASYLYPMIVLVVVFLFESYRNNEYSIGLKVLIIFFVLLAPQYWLTYENTGAFSFIDPRQIKLLRVVHLESNWSGYDTLLPGVAHPWLQSKSTVGVLTAFYQNRVVDLLDLIVSRMGFYFSSFVPFGKVYLSSPLERTFSIYIAIVHLAMFSCTFLYLGVRAWRVILPLSLILGESLMIVPEQRFIFVIQLLLVFYSFLFLWELGQRKVK
jgi:hypothetical protein